VAFIIASISRGYLVIRIVTYVMHSGNVKRLERSFSRHF